MTLSGGLTGGAGDFATTATDDQEEAGPGMDSPAPEGVQAWAEQIDSGEIGTRVVTTDPETGESTVQKDTLSDENDPLEPGSDAEFAGDGPSESSRRAVVEADDDVTRESAGLTDASNSSGTSGGSGSDSSAPESGDEAGVIALGDWLGDNFSIGETDATTLVIGAAAALILGWMLVSGGDDGG